MRTESLFPNVFQVFEQSPVHLFAAHIVAAFCTVTVGVNRPVVVSCDDRDVERAAAPVEDERAGKLVSRIVPQKRRSGGFGFRYEGNGGESCRFRRSFQGRPARRSKRDRNGNSGGSNGLTMKYGLLAFVLHVSKKPRSQGLGRFVRTGQHGILFAEMELERTAVSIRIRFDLVIGVLTEEELSRLVDMDGRGDGIPVPAKANKFRPSRGGVEVGHHCLCSAEVDAD